MHNTNCWTKSAQNTFDKLLLLQQPNLSYFIFFLISAHLKEQLETYMAQYSMVRIVRERERVGLIRARLSGARHATADVLTYLDSHCECTTGKK